MKTTHLLSLLFVVLLFSNSSIAQVGMGALKGKIVDKSNGEPIPYVNIMIFQDSTKIAEDTSDVDGDYTVRKLPSGAFKVIFTHPKFVSLEVISLVINRSKITFYDVSLKLILDPIDGSSKETIIYKEPSKEEKMIPIICVEKSTPK